MYFFDGRVRYSECDENGLLTLTSLIDYLQDCSTFQSEDYGVGLDFLREHHFAWFISAWRIEIDQLPRFGTPIRINTWCYGMKRALAGRNFSITTPEGAPLVRADSQWFCFDTAARRPIRIPESEQVYLEGDEHEETTSPLQRKIAIEGPETIAPSLVVGEQHLDTNQHVNNAQYVLMATDALAALGQTMQVNALAVQYKTMALLGDTIVPHVHEIPEGRIVDLANPQGDSYAIVRLEERPA